MSRAIAVHLRSAARVVGDCCRGCALSWASVLVTGCAAAMPAASFGSTTPAARGDVVLGGAMRIARGDARARAHPMPEPAAYHGAANASGVVPLVVARYGLDSETDLGLVAAGTGARVELRRERLLRQGATRVQLTLGLGASYAYLPTTGAADGAVHQSAFEPLASLGIDFGGLYEVWMGPRLTLGGLFGELDGVGGSLERLRAFRADLGFTLGFAAGLRRVHAFAELSYVAQLTRGALGGESVDTTGPVLVPAFGLRVRF